MTTRLSSILAFLVYNSLVRYSSLSRHTYSSRLWWAAWRSGQKHFGGIVRSSIHGHPVYLNFGYTYPVNSRLFPDLNSPLLELVHQCSSTLGRKINIVDVGAAIGDTILLIQANCPDAISNFCCVEGDPEFFQYLKSNLAHLDSGHFYCAILSDSSGSERSLVRTHSGTASAQGKELVVSTTLDAIIRETRLSTVDVLKIDVDGLDGKVLRGGSETLGKFRPSVVFEWAPIQCEQTGNNWVDHYEALTAYGYTQFIWFDKYGKFSHFTGHWNMTEIDQLAALCLRDRYESDWHYDVVALHEQSTISPVEVAELTYARGRRSRY